MEFNNKLAEIKNNMAQEDVSKLADITESIDNCKLQYYCPQPIVCARLAHAYVPFQILCCVYQPEIGHRQGTIFPELDRPYGTDPEYLFDQ